MYLANTQQLQIFEFLAEDITSDHGFLLRLVNTFTIDTGEYYPVCYKVNNAKPLKTLFYACSQIMMYIADWFV